jgi:hypothetical protein
VCTITLCAAGAVKLICGHDIFPGANQSDCALEEIERSTKQTDSFPSPLVAVPSLFRVSSAGLGCRLLRPALTCRSSCTRHGACLHHHGFILRRRRRLAFSFPIFLFSTIFFQLKLITSPQHCSPTHHTTMAGFLHKGLKNIIQKNPQDVVFLSALRTPVTRAKKGGLRDAYDHELLAAVRFLVS